MKHGMVQKPAPRSGAGDTIYVARGEGTCGCSRCGMTRRGEDAPKYEVGVSHEIRYAFEHAPWLEDERWQSDL